MLYLPEGEEVRVTLAELIGFNHSVTTRIAALSEDFIYIDIGKADESEYSTASVAN